MKHELIEPPEKLILNTDFTNTKCKVEKHSEIGMESAWELTPLPKNRFAYLDIEYCFLEMD
jgi:hypothetical protein